MELKVVNRNKDITVAEKKEELLSQVSDAMNQAEQNGLASMVLQSKVIRLSELAKAIQDIDSRKAGALEELEKLGRKVVELVASNRGGEKGIHGFIGEASQVYINNAKSIMRGDGVVCELLDDGSMTDYIENGIDIQQKACRGYLGLDHILFHNARYPEFQGNYDIPNDFYEKFARLSSLSQMEAGRLSRYDLRIWKLIQVIKEKRIIIRPMLLNYDEIQLDTIEGTIERSRAEIKAEAEGQIIDAQELHKPTVKAFSFTTGFSAAAEAGMSGVMKAFEIRNHGKSFREFDREDAKEIGKASLEGGVKGALRGALIYGMENYTPISGILPSIAVTVGFDSVKAYRRYKAGELTGVECLKTIEKAAIIASAGAIGAKVGKKISPIPIIGEIVGSLVLSFAATKGIHEIEKNLLQSQEKIAACET